MWRKPDVWTLGGRLCSGPKLSVNCCMLRASARAGACWNNVTLTQPHSTPTPGGKKFWCPFFNLHAYRLVTNQVSSHEKVNCKQTTREIFHFQDRTGGVGRRGEVRKVRPRTAEARACIGRPRRSWNIGEPGERRARTDGKKKTIESAHLH